MDLEMEKLRIDATGISVTHQRCKQRSDKRSTSFLVPRAQTEEDLNYAGVVEQYITTIKTELGKFSGRLFWTGNQRTFVNSPLGKNRISEIPKQMAEYLNKENVSAFTFHSLRRSSATAAADSGATAQQMIDFYGWKSCSMPQQYISTFVTKGYICTIRSSKSKANLVFQLILVHLGCL